MFRKISTSSKGNSFTSNHEKHACVMCKCERNPFSQKAWTCRLVKSTQRVWSLNPLPWVVQSLQSLFETQRVRNAQQTGFSTSWLWEHKTRNAELYGLQNKHTCFMQTLETFWRYSFSRFWYFSVSQGIDVTDAEEPEPCLSRRNNLLRPPPTSSTSAAR